MPILHQNASIANLKKIHPLEILPLNMTTLIGHAGYSKVYVADILSRYHDLKYMKVCTLLQSIFLSFPVVANTNL